MNAGALAAAAIAAAAAVTAAGCKGDASKPAAGSGTGGSGTGSAGVDPGAPLPKEIAALPGAIWYVVEDHPPAVLHRFAAGTSTRLGDSLYPSRLRLGDRLVGIRSAGTGAPESEQAVAIAPGGELTTLGTAATQVRDPAVSPDGTWVVVAGNVDGHSELYRIDVAAANVMTAITSNPEGNFHPTALSAKAIAFASSRDGDSEIYRADVDGKNVQRLTAFHKDDWDPVASPDGSQIAFMSDREGRARVFVMAPDGTNQRRLTARTEDGDEAAPAWSPDGTSIAYVAETGGARELIVHDLATGNHRVLTPADARDADPCFSPDGAWIVVARAAIAGDHEEHELWAVGVAPGAPSYPLTRGAGREGLPRWTP